MRVAAIDVGTNTTLLLIAEDGPSGTLVPLHAEQRFIRLGGGVDASRCIGAPALGRLREALLAYRAVAEAWAVSAVVVGATSASRDAVNREAVIDFVHRETGLVYEVLSGKEERFFSRPPRSEEVAAAEALVARLYRGAAVPAPSPMPTCGGGTSALEQSPLRPVLLARMARTVFSSRFTPYHGDLARTGTPGALQHS